ncbi:heterokaryon incompatibility protein-domain-containing protein, partial [Phaeosphaeriaceae sp. PMI808]
MRLLRLENNGGFSLVEYAGRSIPPYAILSHTWGPDDEEVTLKDLTERAGENKAGRRKITFCAQQASQDGLQFFWVDTCCIDKSSSAELSEAINSMFRWYQNAERCYVYLSDVSSSTSDRNAKCPWRWKREFRKSKWFTRGWTLQELLAPRDVIFYDRDWNTLGTKSGHARWISEITAIDAEALVEPESIHGITERLNSLSVAKRMSWASRRMTTRTEDMAYCLLGIFNINMPLLYGEGEGAFIRLQEEILKNCCDDSILAWGLDAEARYPLVPDLKQSISHSPILASSPKDFECCGNLVRATERESAFKMTNLGLEIQLPM